jgi:hypothetical protein
MENNNAVRKAGQSLMAHVPIEVIIYGYVQPSNHIYLHRQRNLIAKKRKKNT